MTHAAVDALRARGHHDLVVLTRDVEHSRHAFGVDAARTLVFPWPPPDRSDYLRRVLLSGERQDALPPDDQVWDFISTLRRCDALLVAGGGNMNSLYGWLLYERVAAVLLAKMLGLRVVVSGQTLGPDLYGPDRAAARSLLEAADLVGAREAASLSLMRELLLEGAAVRPCLDDASFVSTADREPVAVPDLPSGPFIAATFSSAHGEIDRELYLAALATSLDQAASETGLPVVLVPHMATPPGADPAGDVRADGDVSVHQDVAARMATPDVAVLPVQDAYTTISLTGRAALVVTSRYHPVVFALDAGLPVVALAVDGYSDVRMRGALRNWGLADLVLTLPSLVDGTLARAVSDVWGRREELAAYLQGARAPLKHQQERWWDAIAAQLEGDLGEEPEAPSQPPTRVPDLGAGWRADAAAAATTFLPTTSALTGARIESEHVRGEQEVLRRERDLARSELSAWLASRSMRLARRIASVATLVRSGR